MANIRGASIVGTMQYVRETFGDEALSRVLAGLPAPWREALGEPARTSILTNGWYDCALVSDLTREIDRTCGRGDLALARAVGKYVAFRDVNRFFKWLLRLSGPATLFYRAGSVWNNYYSGGRYVLEAAENGRASIRLEDWDCADPVIRESAHLAQDPAVGKVLFCRYEAQWS